MVGDDCWLSTAPDDWDRLHEINTNNPILENTEVFFYFQWTINGNKDMVANIYTFKMDVDGAGGFEYEELIEDEQYRKAGYTIKAYITDENGNGWMAVPGDYTFSCKVDDNNYVNEWNENNNDVSKQFDVVAGGEQWFYPPYFDDDIDIQSQHQDCVNPGSESWYPSVGPESSTEVGDETSISTSSYTMGSLMTQQSEELTPTQSSSQSQSNNDNQSASQESSSQSTSQYEEYPLGRFPFGDADADKDTGRMYTTTETYINPFGIQNALAEAIIIGPEEETFTVYQDGLFNITWYTTLKDGLVDIAIGKWNNGGRAEGSATVEGHIYHFGQEEPLAHNGKIIFHHVDKGFSPFLHNFDEEKIEFSIEIQLTAGTRYYFKCFLSSYSYVTTMGAEAKSWQEILLNFDALSVIEI